MSRTLIRSVAVLGAGTMGAQLAAHLANAGVEVHLFDVSEDAARRGLARAATQKPDAFFIPDLSRSITIATFADLRAVERCDWTIEAVVEDLAVKRDLLARLEPHRAPHAIVSSNTSGIPVGELAAGRSTEFRRHWLGTHFFNPPRYLHLVELIPTPDTAPAVVEGLRAFLDHRLGKGVVMARDTPGFIANRIGVFGAARALHEVAEGRCSIEEMDAVSGVPMGRPKSATFRTLDIAGLDILVSVAADLARRLPDEREAFLLPAIVADLVARGWIGDKAGQGFYRKTGTGGETAIQTLDQTTLTYRDRLAARLPALDAVAAIPDPAARLKALFLDAGHVGQIVRRTLGATLVYAATVAPAVADSIDDVDRAMKWGYGWHLGPFECWDAIGIRAVLEGCGVDAPALVRARLDAGRDSFRDAPLAAADPDRSLLQTSKRASRVIHRTDGASLLDLGEGVLAVEFHSKMNTLAGDALSTIEAGLARAADGFAALVIGNEAEHFSAGANLTLLLMEAYEAHWDEIDGMVRAFQRVTMAVKTSAVPVIAAPAGLALGGGCEICLHADRVQAAAETYMGLVETGVGLIPAGGGTKEMLLRASDVRRAFETIGFGVVSTSAADARRIGYLRPADGVSMNRERLIADARALALDRARTYVPPARRASVPAGGDDLYAVLALGVHLGQRAGRLSDHDARVGRALARVLAGGHARRGTTLTENQLLDLEREAFLSLIGEPKTQERIAYTLKTGKTLRN